MVQDKVMHICFITANYPTREDPIFSFVRELIASIADAGIVCTVISPQSLLTKIKGGKHSRPIKWKDITKKGNVIQVFQPLFLSISKFNKTKIPYNEFARKNAIKRVFADLYKRNKREATDIQCVYGHFWNEGIIAAEIASNYNIKAVVASGESIITLNPSILRKYQDSLRPYIHKCICVSRKNKDESLSLNLVDEKDTIIIPNAIKPEEFYCEDKIESRKRLGFPQKAFIVAFCGYFIDRKGINRLSGAIDQSDDVHTIFIGSGPLEPSKKNNLFCGKVPHDEIVHYLNCADVFVLPTLAEGCCNAIIEAMACGLPIVSSNKSFNDDILTDDYSIRIDSSSVSDIYNAIQELKNNQNRLDDMSKNAYIASQKFHLNVRAERIISIIKELV